MPTNNVGAKSHKGASPNPRAPVPRHLLPARAPALVGDLTGRPPDDAMDSTAHGIWPRRAGAIGRDTGPSGAASDARHRRKQQKSTWTGARSPAQRRSLITTSVSPRRQ
ncbi:hypothetical protein ACCO45_004049 [Purpureocillium lilacinum]|uniref:Uncharacterized protein n=1 Tax=Purpureocillium lilacinum TaxID=33203 RepID=A0ACC4E205_PURLI